MPLCASIADCLYTITLSPWVTAGPLSVFCGGYCLPACASCASTKVCCAQYTGAQLRVHQLVNPQRLPCRTSLCQSCTC